MSEIWKDIPGYKGYYQASTEARIQSIDRIVHNGSRRKGVVLEQQIPANEYPVVTLCKNGRPRTCLVHILVAKAFLPNPNNLPEVHHKDFNTLNPRPNNLEWSDTHGNIEFSANVGHYLKGGKLLDDDVREIIKRFLKGDRVCTIVDDYPVETGMLYHIKSKRKWKRIWKEFETA